MVPRRASCVELLPQVHPQDRVESDGGFVEHQQLGVPTSAHASETRRALPAGEVAAQRLFDGSSGRPRRGFVGGVGVVPYSDAK